MLYNCYMVDTAVIMTLNGRLALDFISLNDALFDTISVLTLSATGPVAQL